jgi:hypothetical protein
MTDCFGREILARRKAAGQKGPQAYLNNPVRTFLTENAAAGQKSRPKPNACEISGLRPLERVNLPPQDHFPGAGAGAALPTLSMASWTSFKNASPGKPLSLAWIT